MPFRFLPRQLGPDLRSFDVTRAHVKDVEVAELLNRHFQLMRSQSPLESCHVLPAEALTDESIRLYALREDGATLAIGAIKICGSWGELKSMHTAEEARGRGVGRALLAALMREAQGLGLARLKLETGSGPEHAAARRLYENAGFEQCPPFGGYAKDPLSVFMSRAL
ncbi:GNAT family N-acetyltransferase [uncultured Roseobacter sp.]|uniref:GNAT family N-acetyltransferase n=1 Tax=uncultured Roseobacter sp. TaxID=114847 RepID=UPI0026272A91|nr:GNAT family N-acetyltransferase [uncultured Roseobacter sp.]